VFFRGSRALALRFWGWHTRRHSTPTYSFPPRRGRRRVDESLALPPSSGRVDEDDPVDSSVPSLSCLRQLGVGARERIDLIVVTDVRKRAQLIEEGPVPRSSAETDMPSLGSPTPERRAPLSSPKGRRV
jgi:hypothetical protein